MTPAPAPTPLYAAHKLAEEQGIPLDDTATAPPWPAEPGPLPPPVVAPALPPELLPAGLAAYVVDCARRASIPLELIAAPLLVALASLVGRGVGIYPEDYNDWLVVPNLWGGIVAPPGALKTHAVAAGTRLLHRLANEARDRAEEQEAANAGRVERLEAQLEGIKAAMKDAARKGKGDLDRLQADADECRAALAALIVTERRYITNDPTVEKMGGLLQANPTGLLLERDELAGWLHSFEKQGREGDRAFYLEAWNGTGSYTVDRIARGTVHIKALVISVLGGFQPGKLAPLVEGATAGAGEADGLIQRIQVVVWPDHLGDFIKPDRWPDKDAYNAVMAVFRALDNVAALLPETAYEDGQPIPALRFAPDAQELFDTWRAALEERLRSGELHEAPAFESHLSKYRSLMPSLALLFHLVAVAHADRGELAGPVSLAATRMAAAWCDFLEDHAEKVYAVERRPGVLAAHALATKIRAGAVPDGATARDIYRHHWSGLTTPAQVDAGLTVLEAAGWLRVAPVPAALGRPTEVLRLHPTFTREGHR